MAQMRVSSEGLPMTPPQWRIGECVVHRIDELALSGMESLLPKATPDVVGEVGWLQPPHTDGNADLLGSVHAFAIEIDGRRIVVDTGVGNGKTRALADFDHLDTPFPQRLENAGFAPETVDLVITTHLHTDHVGWNTRWEGQRWAPNFPNARYLVSRTEFDYWTGVELGSARHVFADSVHPVRDAGLLDLVDVDPDGEIGPPRDGDPGNEIVPGVSLVPVPGHTPGQVAVRIDSAGSSAVITGDTVHHPVQLAHPGVCSTPDVDPEQAARTRRALLAELADTDTLLFGSHFAPPTAGLVRSDGAGFRLAAAAS